MKVFKFIANIILKALFIFLLLLIFLLFIYFISIKVAQKRGTLDKIPINMFVILTQSMEPTINPGDIVIDYTPKDRNYDVGDVITYIAVDGFHAGSTITHRIIEIVDQEGQRLYRTKGDSNNTADFSLVAPENIVGRTILKIPRAGYIRQFLVTKVGWIVAVIFPCLVIIGCDVWKGIKKKFVKESKGTISAKPIEDKKENTIKDSKFDFAKIFKTKANSTKKDSDDNEEDFWGIN